MLLIAIALQAAAPAEDVVAQPASEPTPAAEASQDAPEMKMIKKCRKVMDPGIQTLAGRKTVCKYVQVDETAAVRK